MSLIKCRFFLELNWTKNCVMSSVAGATMFKVIDIKLYVPIYFVNRRQCKINQGIR